ncbi:uncharacterized protein AB675_10217 [Cyphellophora attinorum]|uniref:Uncharacterized protein n=1 Tax=Cyphellophora attinorum TaxID=1664694 RepID=A0A0N1GX77_9EURO|nr:uncharacterized protein AB675_10217 [Phialophora attinorum]KPI34806.1 hypothetical protein AB675_10217 [Phialophora attinorum]
MGQIFAGASKVMIWLGATSLQTYLNSASTGSHPQSIAAISLDTDWGEFMRSSNPDPAAWHLANQVMSIVYNNYWQRLWIIQEIGLAQKVCVIYGQKLLTRKRLQKIYWAACSDSTDVGYYSWLNKQRDPSVISTGYHMVVRHPILEISKPSVHQSLGDLSLKYHQQCCSDPRDYVYGLSG